MEKIELRPIGVLHTDAPDDQIRQETKEVSRWRNFPYWECLP